jgi:hypothetical protein
VRVLLVGCCSQGSVAVWDVQLQQQIMALHSPDLSLAALLPVQSTVGPMLAAAAACVRRRRQVGRMAAAAAATGCCQRLNIYNTGSKGIGCSCNADMYTHGFSSSGSMWQQPQRLVLTQVLLQQPGHLVPGASIFAHPSSSSAAAALRTDRCGCLSSMPSLALQLQRVLAHLQVHTTCCDKCLPLSTYGIC